jgi:LCP family protein required for cell wall assembly
MLAPLDDPPSIGDGAIRFQNRGSAGLATAWHGLQRFRVGAQASVAMSSDRRPTRVGRRRKQRPVLRRSLLSALSFAVLLGLVSVGVVAYVYQKYDGQIRRIAALQPEDPNIKNAAKQLHAENFLIIGSDSRQGANSGFGDEAGQRSDTTIVVHLSADHRKATVISIPRDAWVDIPKCTASGGGTVAEHHEMFNSAFSIGGARCTIATVQKLTGIAVTHYVQIDFVGFKRVVNALGSVTICSPTAVNDPQSNLTLHAGNNKLSGRQALHYVRARETLGDGSDLGRIKRQQQFLGVVLRQAMSGSLLSNPLRLTNFLDAATKAIVVDKGTSFDDLRTLASSLHGLNPKRVVFYTAPIANRDYSPPGTDYSGKVLLDAKKGGALYRSIINDTSKRAVPRKRTHAPKPDLNAGDKTCSL